MSEQWKLVPVEPTEDQWGGLARGIMMWLDMSHRTPRALFAHLERCGTPIPQWLRDEKEMQNLDHVPSKGTRCVILYRAMLEAAPTAPAVDIEPFCYGNGDTLDDMLDDRSATVVGKRNGFMKTPLYSAEQLAAVLAETEIAKYWGIRWQTEYELRMKMQAERDEIDAVREKMSAILTDTANALKGEPGELERHSWHDLAEVVKKVIAERDELKEAVESMWGRP